MPRFNHWHSDIINNEFSKQLVPDSLTSEKQQLRRNLYCNYMQNVKWDRK